MSCKNFIWKPIAITRWRMIVHDSRCFSDKSKDPKAPGKKERIDRIQMPGFVTPETKNEEGYFTQTSRHQLEELKKRTEKPKVDKNEKTD